MPRPVDYQLNPDDLAIIQHAMEYDPRPEVHIRAAALHMLYKGLTQHEAAELLDVSRTTIFYWRVRWLEGGVEGLADQPRSGRPAKADAPYIELLESSIQQDPHTYGYAFSVWTVERLAQPPDKPHRH